MVIEGIKTGLGLEHGAQESITVSLRCVSLRNVSARGMFCAGSMMKDSFAWTEMKLFVTEFATAWLLLIA